MYGTFSGISFGLVALAALVVIALALFASPLLAVIIAAVVAFFLLIGMSTARRRSEWLDDTPGGLPTLTHPEPDRVAAAPAGHPARRPPAKAKRPPGRSTPLPFRLRPSRLGTPGRSLELRSDGSESRQIRLVRRRGQISRTRPTRMQRIPIA